MRIYDIGPDDIQVGDRLSDPIDQGVVTHVLEPGLVVSTRGDGHAVFGWVNDAWRLDGNATFNARSAYRDVPNKWVRQDINRVGPEGSPWAFTVDYHPSIVSNRTEAWALYVGQETAQWLADRLNEGHFGEMPTADGTES